MPYDVVLLDLQMPGMDGLEVARAIRGDPALASTRLVLLSSSGLGGRRTVAERAEIDASVSKPVRQSQLYNTLLEVTVGRQDAGLGVGPPSFVTAAAPGPEEDVRTASGRVLVAEDNPINQRVALRMLEKLGYRADVVANGQEAVDALRHLPYDLVLMDCHMPEMDGYAATRAQRRREEAAGGHMPIIALTANALPGEEDACLAAGMGGYLAKLVRPEQLAATLERWIVHPAIPPPPSVAAEAVPRASAIDRTALDAIRALGGSDEPGLLAELIGLFLGDAPARLVALDAAVAQGDAQTVEEVAHRLKGSCRQMGAGEMARLCAVLEAAGAAADLHGVPRTVQDLSAELARVTDQFTAILAEEGTP